MIRTDNYEMRTAEIRYNADSGSRTVEGYAAVFNSDSVNFGGFIERMLPGSITEQTIAESDVLALLDHDKQKVLARSKFGKGSLHLSVDSRGLKYSFEAPDTVYGNELIEQLKRGDLSQSSFCFLIDTSSPDTQEWYRDKEGMLRRDIKKVAELRDISPCYYPAYESTECVKRSIDSLLTDEEKEAVKTFYNQPMQDNKEVDAEKRNDEVEEPVNPTVEEPVQEVEVAVDAEEQPAVEEPVTDDNQEPENQAEEVAEAVAEATEDNEIQEPQERSYEAKNDNKNLSINRNMANKKNYFSLTKAIRSVAFPNLNDNDEIVEAVLEAGRECFRNSNREISGQIQIPTEARAITVTGEGGGDEVVEVELQNLLFPYFENKILLNNVRRLTGIRGDIKYPRISKSTANWEGEITTDTETGNTIDAVTLTPHRVSATVYISKQMLIQNAATPSIDDAVKTLLIEALLQKIESTFMGAGAADNTNGKNIPAGLFYGKTASSVNDFAGLCALESAAVEDCVDLSKLTYILSPKAWAEIRANFVYNKQGGKTTRQVLEGSEIDGRKFLVSQYLGAPSSKTLSLIDFDSIVAAFWDGLDINIDSTSVGLARSGQIAITASVFVDMKALRNQAVMLATIGASNNVIDPSVGI